MKIKATIKSSDGSVEEIVFPLNPLPSRSASFVIGEEPEIIHIIKSGFENTYFLLFEDAYETEPYKSGVETLTKEKIMERFDINIDEYVR